MMARRGPLCGPARTDLPPRTTVTRPFPQSAAAPPAAHDPEPRPAGTGTVLYVEDDPLGAQATAELLRVLGWRVEHAPHAEAALELLDSGRCAPDVVLADIAMPGEFDGMELAVHLRSTRPSLRVVLMTGYVSEVHRAAWNGFELLPKPCPPSLLAQTLARPARS
jgi:CheY-like chemotaxis protein